MISSEVRSGGVKNQCYARERCRRRHSVSTFERTPGLTESRQQRKRPASVRKRNLSLSPDSLTGIYNRAFGTIGQDGVACIVTAFSEQVTDSQMQPKTMQRFYVEFSNTLKGFFDKLKTLKLVATR